MIKINKYAILLGTFGVMAVAVVALRLSGVVNDASQKPVQSFSDFSAPFFADLNELKNMNDKKLGSNAQLSQQITIGTVDSQTISAYISKPQGSGPFPLVVMMHDAPVSAQAAQDMSRNIGEAIAQDLGAVVVSIDYRSEQNIESDTLDLISTMEQVSQYTEINSEDIRLIGIGRGSQKILRVLQVEKGVSKVITAAVLISPYTDPLAVYTFQQENKNTEAQFFPRYFQCSQTAEQKDVNACLTSYALPESLIATPTLIIQQTDNKAIPMLKTEELKKYFLETALPTIKEIDVKADNASKQLETNSILSAIHLWFQTVQIQPAVYKDDAEETVHTSTIKPDVTNSNTSENTNIDAAAVDVDPVLNDPVIIE